MDVEFNVYRFIPAIKSKAGMSPPCLDSPRFVHLEFLLATVVGSTKFPIVILF